MTKNFYFLCVSSSVSNYLKDKIFRNWPVYEYWYPRDTEKPVCFLGMYHERDCQKFLNHKGKKMIFWCGNDILGLNEILVSRNYLAKYRNICENEIEQKELKKYGIEAEIHPTFAGNVNDYYPDKNDKDRHYDHAWLCARPDREKEYGIDIIKKAAKETPYRIYHIYGLNKQAKEANIIYHGKVSEKKLDEEIKKYDEAIRLNEFDGFSEVIAKGILLGHRIVTRIYYPNLNDRNYWIKKLTDFSWLQIE